MPPTPPFTEWNELPLPPQDLGPLRLVDLAGKPVLFGATVGPASKVVMEATGHQHEIQLAPITPSGSTPPPFAMPALFDMMPDFDLAADQSGRLWLAIERFQGGSHALVVGEAQNGTLSVSAVYQDFTDYRRPRFVRGGAKPGSRATAVTDEATVSMLASQPLDPKVFGEVLAPLQPLVAGDSGMVIARTSALDPLESAVLLAKTPPRGSDALPNGDRPSALMLQAVTGGKLSGKPLSPFGAAAVFNFDADVQGDLALILGATEDGPRLISCDLNTGKITAIAWPPDYPVSGTWAASPSVLALPGSKAFALAFYEGKGSDATGIRHAQLELA